LSIQIIIGIATATIALSAILIERQKRLHSFNAAIQKTIDSITERGRNCKVAVLEDFPDHERLFMELKPYLLFLKRSKTDKAWENYKGWYKTIDQAQKQNVLNILGADSQSEIDTSIYHLKGLLKKI
jgi:hypothetical protein